jgi:hypothetical protein
VLLNTSPYVGTWRVRVMNFNTLPISDVVVVRSTGCTQNVVILNTSNGKNGGLKAAGQPVSKDFRNGRTGGSSRMGD